MMRPLRISGTVAFMVSVLWVATFGAAVSYQPAKVYAKEVRADVVTLGGAITEIVFALGEGDRVKARDSTSNFPSEVQTLPDVGYVRALSPESVLSLEPGLILAQDGAGPQEAIDVISASRVPFVEIPSVFTADGVARKIEIVGDALGVPEKADELAAQILDDLADAQMHASQAGSDAEPPRVMFIISAAGGRIMASGTNTAAHALIELAGGVNAITQFEGYKPITDEAILAAAPEAILMMDRGGAHALPDDQLLALPAMRATPVAETGRVIRMDGLLMLGFGPRLPEAVSELVLALYPE